jgi:hypothetical protein
LLLLAQGKLVTSIQAAEALVLDLTIAQVDMQAKLNLAEAPARHAMETTGQQ